MLFSHLEPDPQSNNKLLSSHPSTTSITSNVSSIWRKKILNSCLFTIFVYPFLQQSNSLPPKRMPSPSPSNGSTTSSTSLVSEGRKSTTSGGNAQAAKKFGESIINFFSWNQFQNEENFVKSTYHIHIFWALANTFNFWKKK